ncbi:MAG: translation elongation factor Ts [Verrucomicrobia bacterium]|nr:translation elongation factor Ts [Verrucomicrobiota bacterium]
MAEITASAVAKLREMTGAGLMECKKSLVETHGDIEAAVDLLRKRGVASAAKKASRAANEGVISQHIVNGGRAGVIVEINCETDFVAKNETFRAWCDDIARKIATESGTSLETGLEADRVAAVAKIGENIKISRHQRFEVQGSGLVAAYIHTGAKVGVLVEVGAGNPATVSGDAFKQLVRDITLQIAAASPTAIRRAEVPATLVQKEKEIIAQSDSVKGKPAQAMTKIIEGKLNKFYENSCLLEQGFVKNPDLKVEAHVASVSKQIGDEITLRRFVRFQVGDAPAA